MAPKLQASLRSLLGDLLNFPIHHLLLNSIGGGSINQTFELIVNHQQRFFAKMNSTTRFPALFDLEVKGLSLLREQKIFRVPEIIAVTAIEERQWLILEWIETGIQTNKFWKSFGERLAILHSFSNDHFGLNTDNYMGALKQSNKKSARWDQFFITERLQPQVKSALDSGLLEQKQVKHFDRLYQNLGDLFPLTNPSLLHGDLWSGNFICDQHSEPVLIDPATYFGHAAMDLGLTELFGGFDDSFYQAYAANFPLPSNFAAQREICRLYPLLIHLNLFGRSYLPAIKETIARF